MSLPQDRAPLLRSVDGTAPATAPPAPSQRLETARRLFDPSRLRLARHLVARRKNDLAGAVGVSASAVGQYESGTTTPSTETLALLALHLGVPVEFFHRTPHAPQHDPAAAHFRSLRATSQLERNQALAFGELVWHTARGLSRWVQLPTVGLPSHPVQLHADLTDVEKAAARTRDDLGLGTDPVGHVVRLVESRGVLAAVTPDRLSARVDAFSHWIGGQPVMVLSAAKDDAARSRFDAAHELGHLVMHHDAEPGSQLAERQAHLFASCLLAPPEVLVDQLPRRVDWGALGELKSTWGMSLKSLAFAANRLGVWRESTYRTAMVQYNSAGWGSGVGEPVSIGSAERPSVLGKAAALVDQHGVPVAELAEACGLPAEVLSEVLQATSDRPRLRLSLD